MKPGTGKDKNSLEQLYSEEVVKDFSADGSAFVSPEAQVNEPKAFANTGPKSPGTELPNPLEKKNVQEDNHFSPQDFSQNEEKMDEETINNSKLMSNEKSTFDKLYEDVMGDEGLMLTREEEDMPGMDMDMGGLDDDLGDDEGGDMVTLSLPRDLAEALHDALMGELGGGDDDLGDLVDDDEMDLDDADDEPLDEMKHEPLPKEMHGSRDDGDNPKGSNAVGGDVHHTGGDANTGSFKDGGVPQELHAPDLSGRKSNKVSAPGVSTGKQSLFH